MFSVTRVIFVPQGEFMSYAALSLALLQAGQVPGVVYVLVGGGLVAAAFDAAKALRDKALRRLPLIARRVRALSLRDRRASRGGRRRASSTSAGRCCSSSALVVPLGPIVYRVAYQPLANASVLVLFIASMAVHYVLQGLGLVFFGGEGLRSAAVLRRALHVSA